MTNDIASNYGDFIERYEVDKYLIHIYYLNGKKESCELTMYNIDKLNEKMIEQALTIVNERSDEKFKLERSIKEVRICLGLMAGIVASTAIMEFSINNPNEIRTLGEVLAAILIPALVYVFRNINNMADDQDIEKYKMFIEHKDDFNQYRSKETLYDGIHKKGYVGINNLDKYTYEEIEKMVRNIDKTRKRSNS